MEIFPRNYRFSSDTTAQQLLQHLKDEEIALELEGALVFCEFPLFREDDDVMLSQLMVISPKHGLLIFGAYSGLYSDDLVNLTGLVHQTEAVFAQVYSKLIKSARLRRTRTALVFGADAAVYAPEAPNQEISDQTQVISSLAGVSSFIRQHIADEIDTETISEITSVIEGSKGLIRSKDRKIAHFHPGSKVALVKNLEDEIKRFDREQRLCFMTEVFGPQRITGLAGSGKTVVIAMQAALAHLKNPDADIAVTFYTKSLYQHIKQLITRFYRQFDDRDPDWEKLRVLHAWGGQVNEGLYHYSATLLGETPLTFGQASQLNPRRPFEEVCRRLLVSNRVKPLFDYIFIDEAQDFTPAFLQLALKLARDEKLVIAYDVFQTIFDVEIPSAEVLFGLKEDGQPAVKFEEDLVLHKCYRNPLEILVCAHAIGFGLYSERVVQMLESREHWEDFGYIVEQGELISGERTVVGRPLENSPSSISNATTGGTVIEVAVCKDLSEEINLIAAKIQADIQQEGLQPEDILVICADDKNARTYFSALSITLRQLGIKTNNLQSGSFSIQDFFEKDHVTLSTVYKAKGNEAVQVCVIGIDALFYQPNARNRNIIFTAMTRAKGWLHVSGIGEPAGKFKNEIDIALSKLPKLDFTFPSEEQLIRLKRDLSQSQAESAATALDDLEQALNPDEYERLLQARLNELRKKRRTATPIKSRPKKIF